MEIDKDKFIKVTSWEDSDFGLVFEWDYVESKKVSECYKDISVDYFTSAEFIDWADRHDQIEFIEESFIPSREEPVF